MINDFFDNYEPFYLMVLSSAIMSNAKTKELEQDASKIIDLIGKAYRLNSPFIEECKQIIMEQLSLLSLTTEQEAIYNNLKNEESCSEADILFDIKNDVLRKVQSLCSHEDTGVNTGWFDYSHYIPYNAKIRYKKINMTSASGNLIATRQAGLMKMLGIGCSKNPQEAIKRFFQCVYWGDIPSAYLLAYAYQQTGNRKQSETYYELAELESVYLNTGCTVLPQEVKSLYSEEAKTNYIYVATIKQDIVYAYNKFNIDFSFLEAIFLDSLDFFDRMRYINNYDKKEWKDITNSSNKPASHIGFR